VAAGLGRLAKLPRSLSSTGKNTHLIGHFFLHTYGIYLQYTLLTFLNFALINLTVLYRIFYIIFYITLSDLNYIYSLYSVSY